MTVDESMVRFKGRSEWKTMIKGKPTPVGYKVYTVASHGYLLNFHVYRGRGGHPPLTGRIHHTVMELLSPWQGSCRTVFFDNLYTSPHLFEHLHKVRLAACGTFRATRTGLPSDLRSATKALCEGQTKAWQKGPVAAWCGMTSTPCRC